MQWYLSNKNKDWVCLELSYWQNCLIAYWYLRSGIAVSSVAHSKYTLPTRVGSSWNRPRGDNGCKVFLEQLPGFLVFQERSGLQEMHSSFFMPSQTCIVYFLAGWWLRWDSFLPSWTQVTHNSFKCAFPCAQGVPLQC